MQISRLWIAGIICVRLLQSRFPIGLTSIPQLPVQLLSLLFTPNLITVILSTTNSLSLNYPVSSRCRTLLFVSLLKLQVLPYHSHHALSPLVQNQLTHRIQCPSRTRFSSVVTLTQPPTSTSLKITEWLLLSLCVTVSLESTRYNLCLRSDRLTITVYL